MSIAPIAPIAPSKPAPAGRFVRSARRIRVKSALLNPAPFKPEYPVIPWVYFPPGTTLV